MFTDGIFKVLEGWEDMVDMKNPYQFGTEDIDMEDFQELLEMTYDEIRCYKENILDSCTAPDEVFDYAILISLISRYIPDTCTDDESPDQIFTVTYLLTEALLGFALDHGNGFRVDDGAFINGYGSDSPRMIGLHKPEGGGFLVYDFDEGDYSAFSDHVNEALGGVEAAEGERELEIIKVSDDEDERDFIYDEDELENACEKVGLNGRLEDPDLLCGKDHVKATYRDLATMAESGKYHMYFNDDSWDVERLSNFISKYPFLYAELLVTKESEPEFPPYKIELDSIGTLVSFYDAGKRAHAAWENLISSAVFYSENKCVEAERHSTSDGESCSFKVW